MRVVPSILLVVATIAPLRAVTFESGAARTTLLELYTSEGCSSCPPAEKRLAEFRTDPGLWTRVVPVAFHVNYWDALGWLDRFATPEFTARQRDYGALWRAETIYTPTFVANGRDTREGDAAPSGTPGRLRAEVAASGEILVTFRPADASTKPLVATVVPLATGIANDVRRGENAGRRLPHEFVALALLNEPLEARDGIFTASLSLPRKTAAPVSALAVWVHPTGDPTPIQATGGWLKN